MIRQLKCLLDNGATLRNAYPLVVKTSNSTLASAQTTPEDLSNAKPYSEMPGPKPVPFFGNVWRFFPYIGDLSKMDFAEMAGYFYNKYGNISKLTGLPNRGDMVLCFDPNDVEKVFRNEGQWPYRSSAETIKYYRTVTRRDVYEGILGTAASQGEEWQTFRSKVNPTMMQPRATKIYVEPIDAVADDFIRRIKLLRDEKQEMPANFNNELCKWTLESIAYITLDTRLGCLKDNLAPGSEPQRIIDAVEVMIQTLYELEIRPSLWKYVSTPAWRKFVQANDEFTDMSLKYIGKASERLKSLPKDSDRELTVLEKLLLRDPNPKTAMVMALDMLFAGIDTTAYATAVVIYHLAKYPEKQQKLFEEIKKHLPDKGQPVTSEILNELKYLKACIKEAMRLRSIALGTMRRLDKDIVLSNYVVPKGTDIVVEIWYMGNMEKYTPLPDQFIPERWLKLEDGGKPELKVTHPFVYMPFGFGARMCVGRRFAELEMETLLTKIVRNFHTEYNYGEMKYKSSAIYYPVSPLKFKFVDRQ